MLLVVVSVHVARGNNRSTSNVVIECREYRAEINPSYGGNCVRLTHLPSGIEMLRTPKDTEELERTPLLFGMPLLFFPNRISNGKFMFDGREYLWPINEPERNVAIHGELYHTTFTIIKQSKHRVEMEFVATTEIPYLLFPHSFVLHLIYKVDMSGLHQEVRVRNTSNKRMPFGLAFHTTFNIPFVPGGFSKDVYLTLPVDKEYPRDTVKLVPIGERLTTFPLRRELRTGILQPNRHPLSNFYSRQGKKEMLLTDVRSGWSISYRADRNYNFWMLWNGGRDDLLTVEPQTCLIDAFNVDRPISEKGIIVIEPGSVEVLRTTIALKHPRSKNL